MDKKNFSLFLVVSLLSLFAGCKEKQITYRLDNDKYVESISATGIGRMTPIVISFNQESLVPLDKAISLSPAVAGEWNVSEDNRTAVFTPEKPYKQNSKITLKADCRKLFGSNEASQYYEHQFFVSAPSYEVSFDEIHLDSSKELYSLSGNVVTDIPVTEEEITPVLNAKLANLKQSVEWTKSSIDKRWDFTVKDLAMSDKDRSLVLSWNGKSLGLSGRQDKLYAGSKKITIPGRDQFEIVDINTSKENTILVSFSKVLDAAQDIASFVSTLNENGRRAGKITTTIRGNILTIFNDGGFADVDTVSIEKGVKASDGSYLLASSTVKMEDKWEIPAVEFLGNTVILPTSQGTVFPIRTKNLTGCLVQVYEIYDRNMIQFLQSNDLNEKQSINRVGEPVFEKKYSWNWDNSMQNNFVNRGLDLSAISRKYPGGMFHVRVSFSKSQIKYVCRNGHQDFSKLPFPEEKITPYSDPTERSSWDYWDEVRGDDRDTYWRYEEDPCHPAFYMSNYRSKSVISKNILVSDLGMMAKRDVNDNLYVTVADIKTAKPVSGAEITLKNYVGSTIATGKTDGDGNAVFKNSGKTFVVIASANRQSSYLKVTDSNSLSTSHFETGGVIAENGIKGFIYGERGVWRPGDDIYLTFVVQDLEKRLPENIPVKFELTDPLGRLTDTQVLTNGVKGFYPIKTKTGASDVTGLWTATAKIGGKKWSKYVSIEVVVPNKLSVELDSESKVLNSEKNRFTITSKWLHGAPTPNFKAEVSVKYAEVATAFDGYADYTFKNPENQLTSSRETVWEGKLDSSSKADFSLNLNAGRSGQAVPGKLKANFVTKVFEPSGGFSTQAKSFDYSPYERYVGLKLPKGDAARNMLLTDTDHTASVVLLSSDGKPVQKAMLSWTMYKLEWKWWWEKDAYTDATHVSSYYRKKVSNGNFNIENGKGSFNFQIKYPDWGRYIIIVNDVMGHSAAQVVYIDWPGWAGRAQEDGSGSASMVPLTASKKLYKTGETAEISFSSGKGQRALVTIEKSGNIVKQQWIETAEGTTVYRLPLTADMAPNVYVHVTLLQQHLQTANSLPIRLYGVIPVNVDNPATTLKPVITTVPTFEPNSKVTVSVSEASGKPMTYTLAVVDEGLLGLTNYHSPELRSEFYKKEASQLVNWDLYKYVMSAYSGKLETILSIGGSEDLLNNNNRDENRFTPVVKYFGPFTIAAGEKKATSFDMPNYIGAVRAMVIAGNDGAYGTTEKTVPVKTDLMVSAGIPRTLGVNEKISIPVTVFNCMEKTQSVTVSLTASGTNSFSENQNIQLAPGENKVVSFTVGLSTEGKTTFIATAKTAAVSSKTTIPVEVESRGIPVTYKKSFIIKGGKSQDISVTTPGEKSTTKLTAEISLLPQLDLDSRLKYLTQYPHGCIEQITSGGFPQLYLPGFVKMSAVQVEKIKDNVRSVFERYPRYQISSGAMGYWPGNSYPSEWGTCYAVHFMTEAKNKGYEVPSEIYDPAISYIREMAVNWINAGDSDWRANSEKNVQAYRLYVLALAGQPELGAMNRLYPDVKDMNEPRLLLAAAYAMAGRKNISQGLLKTYSGSKAFYRYLSIDFSSSTREKAMFMMVSNLMENKGDSARMAKDLCEKLSSDDWLSTQETAWSLSALMPYYLNQRSGEASYDIATSRSSAWGKLSEVCSVENLVPDTTQSSQKVTVKNTGSSVLYGTITASGRSLPGTEGSAHSGLNITVNGLLTAEKLKAGDSLNFMVIVDNTSGKNLENIALTVPVPTCFEFTNERLSEGSDTKTVPSEYTYQDIKDDAIYTYFDMKAGEVKRFTFRATIAYTGNYYIPAVHAEAMYDDDIKAVVPGKFVQMIK